MNTNEKRKLEALVASKLSTVKTVYKHRRETEYKGISRELESNSPEKLKAIIADAEKLNASHRSQVEALKAKALALGFSLGLDYVQNDEVRAGLISSTRWVNGEYQYTYTEPTLAAHAEQTNKVLSQFDDILSRYSVEIWSETADMKNIFDKFEKELTKVGA